MHNHPKSNSIRKYFNIFISVGAFFWTVWYGPWVGNICWRRFLGLPAGPSPEYWEKYSGCIGTYLAQNLLSGWTRDGIRSRGLLGLIARFLSPESISIDVLNMFWLLCLIFITFLFGKSWLNISNSKNIKSVDIGCLGILLIYLLGPGFSLNVENMGDPMHLCIAILGIFLIILRSNLFRSTRTKSILAFTTLAICTLIHESTLFLIFPPFLIILRAYLKQWKAIAISYIIFCLIYLGTCYGLKLVIDESQIYELSNTYYAYNWRFPEKVLYYRGQDSLNKSFSLSLLKSPRTALTNLSVAWMWPSCLIATMSLKIRRDKITITTLMTTFSIMCAMPLYLIATDWGRFAALQVLIIIITCDALCAQITTSKRKPQLNINKSKIYNLIHEPLSTAAVFIMIIATIMYWPPQDHMTYSGINEDNIEAARIFSSLYILTIIAFVKHFMAPRKTKSYY